MLLVFEQNKQGLLSQKKKKNLVFVTSTKGSGESIIFMDEIAKEFSRKGKRKANEVPKNGEKFDIKCNTPLNIKFASFNIVLEMLLIIGLDLNNLTFVFINNLTYN